MSSYVVGIPLLLFLLVAIALIPTPPTATAASSKYRVECTMCAACDNPCGQYLSPPPPSQPAYPYYSPPPPPPYGGGGGGAYYPPPPPYSPLYSPPSGEGYPTPPPPNPILPYFPFYFHIPPPSSMTPSKSSRLAALAQQTTCAVAGFVLLLFV